MGLPTLHELLDRMKWRWESVDLDKLNKLGIRLHTNMINSSMIVVTYPPKSILPPITEDEIFKGFNSTEKFTLYIHIPFCTGACHYCGFSRWLASDKSKITEFLKALENEASLIRQKFGGKVKIQSIYIGGGTPTTLLSEQVEMLFGIINENFELAPGAEVTVEGSPETMDERIISLLKGNGVTRISIGAESFDNLTLKNIGRRHDAKMTIGAFEMLKKGGFENINFDLIRGLPGYTIEKMYHDLEITSQYRFPSISSYAATVKPNTIWSRKMTTNPSLLPSEVDRIRMHILFTEGMHALGYNQKPVDWFNIESQYEYNQQAQKWDEMISSIALGPSSYGYLNGTQYYNEGQHNLQEYYKPLKEGRIPIRHGFKLGHRERARRNLIFGLKYGINIKKFTKKHDIEPRKIEPRIYDSLRDAVLIKENNGVVELSYVGKLFADEIMSKFYSKTLNFINK
jgi:oxygen-independent coproporphyrinogen-3 oxidase